MKPWVRIVIGVVGGIALGGAAAFQGIRAGASAATTMAGPWSTWSALGSADGSMRTRAVVAVRGLLALPSSEARYYTADVDDAGRPLEGRCRYRVTGGTMATAWWTLTLYDTKSYLAGRGPYSVASGALPAAEQRAWTIRVSPDRQAGLWLPTAGLSRFDLTLRTYVPANGGTAGLSREELPRIVRESCA